MKAIIHEEGVMQQAWNVYLRGRLIDTVFYDSGCDADYVRRELIGHDGYDPAISVKRRK